jgi:hypothetical protein
MEIWYYIEQAIIGGLFLLACRQIINQFRPQKQGGCAKGCGDACPASKISAQLEKVGK